jgi:hypothetical protein
LKKKQLARSEVFMILNESIIYLMAYGVPYSEIMIIPSGIFFEYLKQFSKFLELKAKARMI